MGRTERSYQSTKYDTLQKMGNHLRMLSFNNHGVSLFFNDIGSFFIKLNNLQHIWLFCAKSCTEGHRGRISCIRGS